MTKPSTPQPPKAKLAARSSVMSQAGGSGGAKQSDNQKNKNQSNQKPQKQTPAAQARVKPLFHNIQREFNFTDETQNLINSSITSQCKQIESATPSQPQVIRIGRTERSKDSRMP